MTRFEKVKQKIQNELAERYLAGKLKNTGPHIIQLAQQIKNARLDEVKEASKAVKKKTFIITSQRNDIPTLTFLAVKCKRKSFKNLMEFLEKNPYSYIREIANFTKYNETNLSTLFKQLEQRGLVHSYTEETKKRIALTDLAKGQLKLLLK